MGISKPSPTVVRTNRAQRQSQSTLWEKSFRRGSARDDTLPSFSSLSPASTTFQTSVLKKPRQHIYFSACAKAAVAVGTLIVALITLAVYNHRSDRLATWTALKDWREACVDDKTNSREVSPDCQQALSKPLPRPPYMPVEYFSSIVKRTVSISSRNASRARFEGLHVSSWPSTTNSTKCLTFETSSTQACLAIKAAALFAMILLVGSCFAGLYWLSMPSTAVQDDHVRPSFLAVPPYRSKKQQTGEDYYSAGSTPLVGLPSYVPSETHSGLRYRGLTRNPPFGSDIERTDWSMANNDDSPSSLGQHFTDISDSWIRTVSNTSTKPKEPSTFSDQLASPDDTIEKLQRNESRLTKWLISKIPSATTKVKSGSAIQGLAEIGAVAAATAGGKAGQEEALEIPNKCLNVSMPQNPQDLLLGSVACNIEAA